MNRFLRWGLWALMAAGCLALCLTGSGGGLALEQAAALPFAPVGRWLRSLSLSGPAGNAAALALYWVLSLLPLALLIPLRRQPVREDWLLGLAVPVGLAVWWCAVNPGWLFPASEAIELACLGGAFWMLMLCWALLRWLRRGSTLRNLSLALEALGLGLVTAIFGGCFGQLCSSWQRVLAGNTGGHALSQAFLLLQFAVSALPYGLELWVLASARRLVSAAAADRYSDQTLRQSAILAGRCRTALCASLLTQTGFDLLQLLCLRWLRTSQIQLLLPLDAILLLLLALCLSRLLTEGRQLRDDNDAII